jgi:hypothetical protein
MPTEDGGFYAIKGFLYQFDKSLIEIIKNPQKEFTIENIQDVNCENFVIQVKHHAAQDYAPSKIRKPISQILDLFSSDPSKNYCLYCHFKNRKPEMCKLSLDELDRILGVKERDIYSLEVKRNFIENFTLIFSEDYEEQFLQLITLIEAAFSLTDKDLAFLYHSIIRSNLIDIAIIPEREKRLIKKSDLDTYLNSAEKEIFYSSYSKYLTKSKYEALVKKEFFTFKAVNLNNFERLFIIDCDDKINKTDLIRIIVQISRKYFRANKSPAPYILLRSLSNETMVHIKRDLIDIDVTFNDGTQFDGDRFRIDRLKERGSIYNGATIKFVNEENLELVQNEIDFQEVYAFYLVSQPLISLPVRNTRIQITETDQVLKFL